MPLGVSDARTSGTSNQQMLPSEARPWTHPDWHVRAAPYRRYDGSTEPGGSPFVTWRQWMAHELSFFARNRRFLDTSRQDHKVACARIARRAGFTTCDAVGSEGPAMVLRLVAFLQPTSVWHVLPAHQALAGRLWGHRFV